MPSALNNKDQPVEHVSPETLDPESDADASYIDVNQQRIRVVRIHITGHIWVEYVLTFLSCLVHLILQPRFNLTQKAIR